MIRYNTLVVLAGITVLGGSAGLVGCLAVLRRRALTGDALAHAALPGVCLAFIVLDSLLSTPAGRGGLARLGIHDARNLPALLCGALVSGLVGIGVISILQRWTRIKEDAAIGIVLSVFFSGGIALSRLIQNESTTGSKAGLDSYFLGKTSGMIAQDVWLIAAVALLNMLVVVVFYKELRLALFDAEFASAQGWPVLGLDLLLMGLVAVTVVIGLPAVGVVLMAALLILPGTAARFWTQRFERLLWLSGGIGAATGLIGAMLSARYSGLPTGPIVVLVGTAGFLVSLLAAPRRGVLAQWRQRRRFRRELAELRRTGGDPSTVAAWQEGAA